jgi:CubicO group peptidase (beta-lactamase class C family)
MIMTPSKQQLKCKMTCILISKHFLALLLAFTSLSISCSDDDYLNPTNTTHESVEDVLTDIDFNGYAIVTKNGSELVRRGFGLANENTGLAQDYNLSYRIASVTKTLTAAAVVQLKRDGLISSFDQTLDEFDPEFLNGNQISIAQLLSHQSGIPDYQLIVEEAYEQGEAFDEEDIYDVIKLLVEENGLNFSPGSGKQYTNSNFLIASLLVQELSQMPFHDYVQQKILTPLGMTSTHKGQISIDEETHAEGYNNQNPNSTYPMGIAFGVGDYSSTPEDMEVWINAVKNNWFTPNEKAEIFVANVPGGYTDFGLGWFTTQEENTTMYWHGGDINGYWSMIGFIPEYDASIILLSNHQDDSGVQRNTVIEQLLTNEFN